MTGLHDFNPRSSCEERHEYHGRETRRIDRISIHAPHARSDAPEIKDLREEIISIHAPHARSDQMVNDWQSVFITRFQSTLLMRGATLIKVCWTTMHRFQSTLLMRGATFDGSGNISISTFQSTLLMRGATFSETERTDDLIISIHAPHARSDSLGPCAATLH